MRYQPQGLARLGLLGRGAQSVINGATQTDLVSGNQLQSGGGATPVRRGTPAGIALSFRKNYYIESGVQQAIGTQTFVEFWYGYPSSTIGTQGDSTNPVFLTGSSTNNSAIVSNIGSGRGSSNWGALYNWSNASSAQFNNAGEVLTPDVLTLLVVVRRQSGMEFWRDGRLLTSIPQAPVSLVASTFILGAFVEAAFWTSSGDALLAGRIIADWSPDQVRQFSANPWQLFDAPDDDDYLVAAAAGPHSFAYSASGGAVFSGSAARVRGISRVPVGSLTMAGSGQAVRGAARTPQGGLAFSGASSIVRSIARAAAGGLTFAGAAAVSATAQVQARVITPVGGLLLAGAAAVSRATSRAVSGGLSFSGHAVKTAGAAGALLASLLPIVRRRRR